MRLIDADKAIEATWEQPTYTDPLNVLTEVRDRIKELPTVDAVPIKWIENYLRDYPYMAPIEKAFVRKMITAWAERKEE